MITIHQLSHSFGGNPLLENISLQIGRKDRIGLIGPNGAGKSTLFSFILGEQTPDEGTITKERRVTVGFLPQESAPSGDETILQLATTITPQLEEAYTLLRNFPDPETTEHQEALATFAE
jgi:ATP-binding cassette, subfamily F, member 3